MALQGFYKLSLGGRLRPAEPAHGQIRLPNALDSAYGTPISTGPTSNAAERMKLPENEERHQDREGQFHLFAPIGNRRGSPTRGDASPQADIVHLSKLTVTWKI